MGAQEEIAISLNQLKHCSAIIFSPLVLKTSGLS